MMLTLNLMAVLFPGSDDELGSEEVELEGDEDEMYGYYIPC